MQANDIGAGAEGDIYAAGIDGYLYHYEFLANKWSKIEGDFDLTNIVKVDVDSDGTPYVVTSSGDMWYLSCDHKWMRLPGCGTDIGVGRGKEVFKTGCDQREGGYGIYRLFCKGSCKCSEKGCMRYRNNVHKHQGDDKKCYWFRIDGAGIRIDVSPTGYPYAIKSDGNLWGYDGTDWNSIPVAASAVDLTVSNEGALFYTTAAQGIYRVYDESNGSYTLLNGSGNAITVGPYSQPFVTGSDNHVYTASKIGFN